MAAKRKLDASTVAAARIARGSRLLAGGHPEAALAAFRAATTGPRSLRAIAEDGIGRAFMALDRPDLALAHADRAVAALGAPLATVLANRARILLRLGRGDEALAMADAALGDNPTDARALAVKRCLTPPGAAAWPPLAANPPLSQGAAAVLSSAPGAMLVGIAWQSDRPADPVLDDPPGTPGAARADVPLDLCLHFLAPFGVRPVVLRRKPADVRAQRLAALGVLLDPSGADGLDEAQLAAVIAKLDLVVAADGRAAEIAGQLGKPCLVLLEAGVPAFWPVQDPSPARRSLTLLRQPEPGDWEKPLRQAGQTIAATLKARAPRAPSRPAPPPPAVEAALAEGHRLYGKGEIAAAAEAWARALRLDPSHASAWANLGVALRVLGDPEAAVLCHRQALGLGGGGAGTLGNLGNALKDLDRYEESIPCHRRAVELEPDKPGHHHNMGIALRQAGRYDEAAEAFEHALKLNPDAQTIRWDLALTYLHRGEFAKGWPLYEARWQLGDLAMPRLQAPLWQGEALQGKTILLHSEQGFGDAIQCVRYAAALKQRGAARVVLDCKPPLERLFATAPGVDQIVPRGQPLPPHDLHCPLNSLPGRFGTHTTDIPGSVPFLAAPEGAAAKFAPSLALAGTRLKVGIVWSGSVTFKDNKHRATTLARFLRHFGLPEVCLFSLQKGPPEAELRALGPDAPLVDLAPLIEDFADTAAAIGALDLVLMTDSSVAHLAGALGRPVWVLLTHHAHWLWMENDRDTTPWYPSMRFFRQPRVNDWDTPFEQAAAALAALAGRKR